MQLHEAAAKYQKHCRDLDRLRYSDSHTCVWLLKCDDFGGEMNYYLSINPELYPDDILSLDGKEFEEARFITKQRGGLRIFKTLDAVASALQQIGQDVMTLDNLPKPRGL